MSNWIKFSVSVLGLQFLSYSLLGTGSSSQTPATGVLRITPDWSITVPSGAEPALKRAAVDIQEFLDAKHNLQLEIASSPSGGNILLSVATDQLQDGFAVSAVPARSLISVKGSSARATFQGILFLEDLLSEAPQLPSDLESCP